MLAARLVGALRSRAAVRTAYGRSVWHVRSRFRPNVAQYCVASSSQPAVAGAGAVVEAAVGGGEAGAVLAPVAGGPYDGVALEPWEVLMVDRYGEERLKYVGKLDTRELKELDFAEIFGGKYYKFEFTEDQIYAYIFDMLSGEKIGKPENPEKKYKEVVKLLDPDTFGKFGREYDDDLAHPPPKREVFKLDDKGRPLSQAFFTTAPVYYEEMDRLKSEIARLDAAIDVDTDATLSVDKAVNGGEGDGEESTQIAAKGGDDDATDAQEPAVEGAGEGERPLIAGENRVLTWDEKMRMMELQQTDPQFMARPVPPWVDDDGVNFFERTEETEHAAMEWRTSNELTTELKTPLTITQYRRLLRLARQIAGHEKFDDKSKRVLLAYRKIRNVDAVTTCTRRPLDSLGQAYATGRKKHATAVAYLKPGKGNIRINRKDIIEFCGTRLTNRHYILSPFIISNTLGQYDVDINVRGGGLNGRIIACRHATAKALENYIFNTAPESEAMQMRKVLKSHRLLQRDPRMPERRKAGQHGARTKKRWTKR